MYIALRLTASWIVEFGGATHSCLFTIQPVNPFCHSLMTPLSDSAWVFPVTGRLFLHKAAFPYFVALMGNRVLYSYISNPWIESSFLKPTDNVDLCHVAACPLSLPLPSKNPRFLPCPTPSPDISKHSPIGSECAVFSPSWPMT